MPQSFVYPQPCSYFSFILHFILLYALLACAARTRVISLYQLCISYFCQAYQHSFSFYFTPNVVRLRTLCKRARAGFAHHPARCKPVLITGHFLVKSFRQVFNVVIFCYLLQPFFRDIVKSIQKSCKAACYGSCCISIFT